ncbi:MAG TPA: PEP-CTERM sorting domain-containing protein [Verrucomicrobiae bacterium]|nr:PEP-CTERM sorting domain-containing protein [Verrucomicrobiae bacterium]
MRKELRRFQVYSIAAFLAVMGWAATGFSAAVTAPYSQNFDSGTAPNWAAGQQTATGGGYTNTWSVPVTAGNGVYQDYVYGGPSDTEYAYSALSVSNLGGAPATASSFSESTSFEVAGTNVAASAFSMNAGLAALGSANTFGRYTSSLYYMGQIEVGQGSGNATPAGTMWLQSFPTSGSGGVNLTTTSVFNAAIALNTPYTMTLSGTYDASGDLTLLFSVSNGATTTSISDQIAAASVLTGDYFGYRDSAANGGGTLQFDNYALSVVPEPSTLALVGLAGGLIALISRKRKAS